MSTLNHHEVLVPPRSERSTALPSVIKTVPERIQEHLRIITAIARWELFSFFRKPTAYVLLLAMVIVAGWNFSFLVTLLSQGRVVPLRHADDPLCQFLGPSIFSVLSMMLILPLVSMGLVADERRRGTWEMLLTAPVEPGQVIAGKFLAAWSMIMINISPWFLYVLVLRFWNGGSQSLWGTVPWFLNDGLAFDFGLISGGLLGWLTIASTLAAIGIFCSTICRGPFAAAITAVGAMIVLLLLSLLPRALGYWQIHDVWIGRAQIVACWEHLTQFSQGAVDVRIITGHASFVVMLLWLSTRLSRFRD